MHYATMAWAGLLLLFATAVAQLPSTPNGTEPFWQWMKNLGDVQYTTNMTIGGQVFDALVDTGSFEMLAFSQHCTKCGESQSLYNDAASSTYVPGNIHTDHSYGSGTTWSISAFDTVGVGPLSSEQQLFWEVYDADMPLLEQGSPFQLLVGVGPPQSAVKMAMEARDQVKQEVAQRKAEASTTSNDTEDQQILDQYEKTAALAQNTTSLLGKMDLNVFSFCFLKPSGFGGYFVLNDNDPEAADRQNMYTKIPVAGDLYWSAAMTDVQLSGSDETTTLGCDSAACSAVIDTGTSLIVAPTSVVNKVDEVLQTWLKNNGSCSDLSLFPTFEFKLNGTSFSLPPEAYIGMIPMGDFAQSVTQPVATMLAHWKDKAPGAACVPLMMTSDVNTQFGELWILGMPFFRKYYSTFKLEVQAEGSFSQSQSWVPRLSARNMYFSVADDNCKPTAKAEAGNALVHPSVPLEQRRQRAMNVDTKSLRVPRWAQSDGTSATTIRV